MASQRPFIIGVDTGGTYTDAVLVDCATRAVVASAKRPTTHFDLSVGMEQALHAVLEPAARGCDRAIDAALIMPDGCVSPVAIGRVAVSTTLATNAVVEGVADQAVGLIVIGWGNRIEVPGAAAIRHIPGGHRIDGTEQEPLALEPLLDAVVSMRGRVDAYAVIIGSKESDTTERLN